MCACAGQDFPDNTTAGTYDGILPFTGYVAGGNDFTHYDLSKPNEGVLCATRSCD